LGALIQNNIQKIFSYLIICHIGFMIAGLAMNTTVALTGAVFYMIHDIVVKGNLFLVGGFIYRLKGSYSMRQLGGLYQKFPKLSLLFLIPLFSVVGIPPLSGFWPKISLISAGFSTENYLLIGFIIFGSFITLLVIAKLWSEVFWKEGDAIAFKPNFKNFYQLNKREQFSLVFAIAILAFVSLYIGFGAEHIQNLSSRIATELTTSQIYLDAVLNTK